MEQKAVDFNTMDTTLSRLLKDFPNVDPKDVEYVDQNTVRRGGFDFYSWGYWGKKSGGYSSISAWVTGTYQKYLNFTDKMKALVKGRIEETLPPALKLVDGARIRYTGEDASKNMVGQDFAVIGMHRVGDSIIVYYVPERTPVANHSMFHYGLFTNYEVTSLPE